MMVVPWLLRVFLIYLLVAVVSGGIAMLGNQLGRRIGRRKMSVFGMRPRHTSIFITTLTGILIALLTLTLAMVFSRDVRDIVTGSQERIAAYLQREKELAAQVAEYQREVERGSIVWNHGERMALGTIPARSSEEKVRNFIGRTLYEANVYSLKRNVQVGKLRKLDPIDLDREMVELSLDDEQLRDLVDRQETLGFWVVVERNCFYGDQVPVSVQPFEVKKVFKSGEVVAELTVEPEEGIIGPWYDFLESLRESARRRGMIEFEDSLGWGLTEKQLGDISKQLAAIPGPARLVAVAARDLYASNPLFVEIEVLPAKQGERVGISGGSS